RPAGGLARPQTIDAFGRAAGKQDRERRWLALSLSIDRVAVTLLVLFDLDFLLPLRRFSTDESSRVEGHDVGRIGGRRVDSIPIRRQIVRRHVVVPFKPSPWPVGVCCLWGRITLRGGALFPARAG